MYRTDDPLKDFDRYDAEQERRIEKLPRCSQCDSPIQDDYAYYINGEWICDECLEQFRREVDYDL